MAPALRSLVRRVSNAPGSEEFRVHHFLPGMLLLSTSGAAAIVAHRDGREFWFSLPFGVGAGLTLDGIALLVEADNPYWASQRLALVGSGIVAFVAAVLGARFQLSGRRLTRDT
jgi:hypothetical protein